MSLGLILFVLLLVLFSIAAVLAAIYGLRRRATNGSLPFVASLIFAAIWGFGYSAELLVTDPAAKLFWAKLQYLSLPLTPTILIYASAASNLTWHHSWKLVAPLYVIPIITNILLWAQQPLIYASVNETTIGGTMQFTFEYGPWFFISLLSTYLLYFIAAGVIVRLVVRSPTLSQTEAALMLLGACAPFIANALRFLGIEFVPGLDPTPLALLTFGLITAYVAFEIQPIDFQPLVYDAAFQSLPDPAMTVDEQNRILHLNPAGRRQMVSSGRVPTNVISGPVSAVMPAHWYDLIKQPDKVNTVQHEVQRNTGSITEYFDMRISPLRDRRNRFKGRLFVIRDITQRKYEQIALAEREQLLAQMVEERTAELKRTNEELINAVRLKDDFLAGMSHELRTPLSAVIGTTESIQAGVYGMLPPKMGEPIKRIDRSASHLLELINDVLDVSKIEAGNLALTIEPVLVEELCNTCFQLMQADALKKSIDLTLHLDIEQRHIMADQRRLRQVLINLIANAVKFTPTSGRVGLDVTEDVEDKCTFFTVWDTGIGIAEADQARIFAPFVQVDSSLARQYDGTGLGLALTTSLVKMHGGELSVTSELGKGSRFTVAMPWLID